MTANALDIPFADQSQPEVQTALVDHAQAQQLLAVLEEKVRDGDPGVQPSELREAREVVEYAALRVQTAQRAAARRQAEERATAYADLAARTRGADIVADEDVVQAFRDALAGLDRLARLTGRRSAAVRDIGREVAQLVQIADRNGERDLLRAAGIHNGAEYSVAGGPASYTVSVAEGLAYRVTDLPPAEALMAAWCRAMDLSGLHQPEQEPRSALDGVLRLIPALADVRPAEPDDRA